MLSRDQKKRCVNRDPGDCRPNRDYLSYYILGRVFTSSRIFKHDPNINKNEKIENVIRCVLFEVFFDKYIFHLASPPSNGKPTVQSELKLTKFVTDDRCVFRDTDSVLQRDYTIEFRVMNKNNFYAFEYYYLSGNKISGYDYQIQYLFNFFSNLEYSQIANLLKITYTVYGKVTHAISFIEEMERLGFSYDKYKSYVNGCIQRGGFPQIGNRTWNSSIYDFSLDDEDRIIGKLMNGEGDEIGY